jgi:hypothetical protein
VKEEEEEEEEVLDPTIPNPRVCGNLMMMVN